MKKALALVLTLALMLSMAVSVSAASSVSASTEDLEPEVVAPAVSVVETEGVKMITAAQLATLPEEAQEDFAAAKEALEEAAPEGMAVKNFVYFEAEKETEVTFKVPGFAEVIFKQFVNGKWVELKATKNADGTFTVAGVVAGPLAIFVK